MFARKVLVPTSRLRKFDRELRYLYARRSALEILIRSLNDYQQYQFEPGARVPPQDCLTPYRVSSGSMRDCSSV